MDSPPLSLYRWRWLAFVLVTLTIALLLSSYLVIGQVEATIERATKGMPGAERVVSAVSSGWHRLVAIQILLAFPFVLVIAWVTRHQKRELESRTRLLEKEAIFHLLADNMSDLLAVFDRAGRPLYASPSCGEVIGAVESLRDAFSLVHPDDAERWRSDFHRTFDTGRPLRAQYRLSGKNDAVFTLDCQGNVIRNAAGEPEKLIVVARDVTDREQSYQRLERQGAALVTIANTPELVGMQVDRVFDILTRIAAHTLDVDRVSIWFFSENIRSIYLENLYTRTDGKHTSGVELTAAKYPKYFAALAEGRSIAAHDARIDPRTAEFARDYLVPLDIRSMLDAPIRRGGRMVGVICIEHTGSPREWAPDEEAFASSLSDFVALSLEVAEHRKTEQALREARDTLELKVAVRTRELELANERLKELDRLKSEFLATMSHELRTPLNSILGFTGVLRQGLAGPLTAEQTKQLGMVHGAAKHLLGLINDLLDLSRIESGRMDLHVEQFAVQSVVHDVVESVRPLVASKPLSIVTDLDPLTMEVCTDRKKLFQVLLNLAGNAVKFTDAGEIRISVRQTGKVLTFTVRDTGIGIREDQLANLFQAFRQVDGSARRVYEGTGLGLYLSRQLLTLMGGGIRAESVYGQGSVFTFTLPETPPNRPTP